MANDSITINTEELARMLEDAAERGAVKALRTVGLHDEKAAKDLVELRTLLDAWRQVRKGALETLGKTVTMLVLAGLAAGAWFYMAGKH